MSNPQRWLRSIWWRASLGVLVASLASNGWSQRVRVPANYGLPNTTLAQVPEFSSPYANPGGLPSATLGPGIQPFDPYAVPMGPPSLPPSLGLGNPPFGQLPTVPTFDPPPTLPPSGGGWPGTGYGGNWLNTPPAGGVGGNYGYGPNGYGSATGNSALFPNGLFPGSQPQGPPFQRLFQDTGFRHTWLAKSSDNSMQMHDVEVSTTAFFPNFLRGRGPLRMTPGFAFHFLDGPEPPITSDLPSRLYSAYLDFGWEPEFTPQFGADVNFRTGVFSDFDTISFDSIRFMGTGVGVIRVTPATSLKIGATYIDRNKIKILPAAGILWQPNPQTRWDIFFPSPKLASYWTTVGNSQIWWYLGGEYGGGAWTIEREEAPEAGASEQIDINDIRAFLGLEWHNLNRWYGFVEVGYVFDREIYYVTVPDDRVKLDNTIMVRAGISF